MDELERRLLVTLEAVSAGDLSPQAALQALRDEVLGPFGVRAQIDLAAALSGRLAHDLNNHLTGVVGCSDMITHRPDSPDVGDLAQQVAESAQGAVRLAEALGHMARMRRGKEVEGSFDAVAVCKAAFRVANDTLPPRIELKGVWPAQTLRVDCGPGRLARVVLHLLLLLNQRTEGPAHFSLQVALSTEPDGRTWVQVRLKGEEGADPVRWAEHPDMLVLRERGAQIEQAGHCFTIRLPRRSGALDAVEPSGQPAALRVLVVEDEPGVQQFLATVLRRRGCQVFVVNDAPSALELAASDEAHFELLITDLNLPGQSGVQLWKQLRARIGTGVIMTGQGTDDALQLEVDDAQATLLNKPFSPNQISSVLEAVRSKLG